MISLRSRLAAICATLAIPVMGFAKDTSALSANQQLARDIYEELVEINTSQSAGDTFRAARAMAARLEAAGFSSNDVQTFETAPHRGNLVARLRGRGKGKPILLLAHLDVVEAKREDWTTDPYQLVEKDGYFYGRGTADDKFMAAAFVSNFVRYRKEGYRPDRDIVLALTTDEEISDRNNLGIKWLLANHRDLIDAEFALNEGGSVAMIDGKPTWNSVQTTEKLFQSFWLEVRNKGGHSSQPSKDNAIYHLAAGLERVSKLDFPVKLNATTKLYFEKMSSLETGQLAQDMKAVTLAEPDAEAVARLSEKPAYNALLRTTCVATRLEGGHADNALPQLARALVNCRVAPGDSLDYVEQTLVTTVADGEIKVTRDRADTFSEPSALSANVLGPIEKLTKKFWPGIPVIPVMTAGATDGRFLRNAGIPTYGHSGLGTDVFDYRAHGKDERVSVPRFYQGQDYLYELVKMYGGGK